MRLLARVALVVSFCAFGAGCASKSVVVLPPAPPGPPPPPPVSLDVKASWILRLEQQRILRDPDIAPAPPATGPSATRTFVAASQADLGALALDPDPALRRRAALAIGRVGIEEGVDLLQPALDDPEIDVRASAAFALGLIGARRAVPALVTALSDPAPIVRGRAAEALGLVGDDTAAGAVAQASAGCAAHLSPIAGDDEGVQTPEVEACRLALFALVRLRNYDALAQVALDASGAPVSRWWPVAFALQRINDARAAPALLALTSTDGIYTPGFALRGLATHKEARLVPVASALAARTETNVNVRIAAVRALGQVGGAAEVDALIKLAAMPLSVNLAQEVVNALGASADPRAFDAVVDLLTHRAPSVRAAVLDAAARIDPDGFLLLLSGFGRDRDWSVRAALAGVLARLPADRITPAIDDLTQDDDVRVRPAALDALGRVKAPNLGTRLANAIVDPDFAVRAAAARLLAEHRIEGALPRLVAAYERGQSDATYTARAAAIEAAGRIGGPEAVALLERAREDRDWPVRLRAATLLRAAGVTEAQPARPAPLRQGEAFFTSPRLLHPSYSPHAFFETERGTIEVELNVVEAGVTTAAFVDLVRAGFFNGLSVHRLVPTFVVQTGDPRGDGAGGPGYSLQDELSPLPYVRGTVGMALAGPDTGGSQFFFTITPQPHLDGRYTVFGKVVRGIEVLDQMQPWDVIQRVRIWDGTTFSN